MMRPVRYFAYGSNMAWHRLQSRVPGALRMPGHAWLHGHELRFHKVGQDGSAKCDAWHSQNPDHRVYGVLFDLPHAGKAVLDDIEGLGVGYAEKQVRVTTLSGGTELALTYVAIQVDPALRPFDWYKAHVVAGARQAELPAEYIDRLLRLPAIADHDATRAARERSIYGVRPAHEN